MHVSYEDIRKRIAEEPLWFDENGTPRYDPFKPGMASDIYAQAAALVEIACQSCGQRFMVAFSVGSWVGWRDGEMKPGTVSMRKAITEQLLHYGDPPRHDCTGGGDTMNCEDLRVLEYWEREDMEWKRVPEFERSLE